MRSSVALVVRILTGVALIFLAVRTLPARGLVEVIAGVKMVGAVLFCIPRVWRIGGCGLLVVMAVAIAHHAIGGEFASTPFFAALVIVLEVANGRS